MDNWPVTVEKQGLALAPGVIACPTGNNTFETGRGYLLQLLMNGGQMPDGLVATTVETKQLKFRHRICLGTS